MQHELLFPGSFVQRCRLVQLGERLAVTYIDAVGLDVDAQQEGEGVIPPLFFRIITGISPSFPEVSVTANEVIRADGLNRGTLPVSSIVI